MAATNLRHKIKIWRRLGNLKMATGVNDTQFLYTENICSRFQVLASKFWNQEIISNN